MDDKMLKKLSSVISKLPKKDLAKNLEKAKSIIQNSNKEDIKKLLETEQVKKIIGNDTEKLKEMLENTDLKHVDTSKLENDIKGMTKDSK